MSFKYSSLVVIVAAALSFPLGAAKAATAQGADTYRQLSLIAEVFERVRKEYVEPVDDRTLVHAALDGMLSHLDPHSNYIDPDEFKDMQTQVSGSYGGLGLEITVQNGETVVIAAMDDTPAQRGGIHSDDRLVEINHKPTAGRSLKDVADSMRGPVGTPVTLLVARKGAKPFELTLKREIVRLKSVKAEMKGDVGYIRVITFLNETTADELDKALSKLEHSSKGHLAGYVVDLRDNGGGLLDQAIGVSETFLSAGEIVSVRGRQPGDIQRYDAHRGDRTKGAHLVVLINGGTASASEIVAGALQDHKRATLIGTRSFGKGLVQSVIPLNGGADGAIRLTTANYFTPSGRSIQTKGIEPDIVVVDPNLSAEAQAGGGEASLPNHLANPDGSPAPATASAPRAPQRGAAPTKAPAPKGQPIADVQLDRAIAFLHGHAEPGLRADTREIVPR